MPATLYPAQTKGYNISTGNATVLLPAPGKAQPTVGHWRTSATAKAKPKPRTQPRPTSGRGIQVRKQTGTKPPRKRTSTGPSARALHGAWAKGTLTF